MALKPHVAISVKSSAERSLLRFYLGSATTPNIASELVDSGEIGAVPSKPEVVIGEARAGETQRDATLRLRATFPDAALVLLLDDARPKLQVRAGRDASVEAVLVRPLTVERLDAVLAPLLRVAALPAQPRVLVVDDDPEVLHFVEAVLGKAGCDVTTVSDAQRYLARPHAPEFDLALLDVVMPEVDGLQLCLRLRETGRDALRICMMSAAADPETERKADLYGADEFLPKPLHARELHALVGRARLHPHRRLAGPPRLRPAREPGGRDEHELADP